jgi:hypothetical protein
MSEDGQAIDFVTGSGAPALHYAQLKVTDAQDKVLQAWMEGFTGENLRGIRIVVDARYATYPITIDPLTTSPAWTAESDQAGAQFGLSVATAGDVNSDGYSDVIVGAYAFDNGEANEGRAFVYHGSASGLSLTPAWTAESNQQLAYFGYSVATAGDVNGDGYSDLIVGAYLAGESWEGRAFVYHGSVSGLSLTPNWTAESNQVTADFGFSVATAGDVNGDGYADVIVGAPFYNSGLTEGRAFVYHGSASGLSPTANWTAQGQAASQFGYSVATAGDVNGDGFSDVVVGQPYNGNGQADEGRAFVYHGSATGLSSTPNWSAESNQASAVFGASVAAAGDVNGDGFSDVIVGSYAFDNGQADEGRAFLYHGSAAGLSPTPNWTAESDQANAWFGRSVGTAGDLNGDGYADVIVGAYLFDNGQTDEGRAFVYQGSASGLSSTASWTAESDQVNAQFGYSVATAGDVNGDGYSDVIVGAFFFDNGQSDEGRAFLYLGSASGPATLPGWSVESDQGEAALASSVASAGDVNGDGFADLIVGAPDYDNGQMNEGRAYVYLGAASGLAASPAWTAEGNEDGAAFGVSVATAGDVNRDGYSDVIVGADADTIGGAGRASVYLGSPVGLAASPVWTAPGDQNGALFGVSVASAGDVNGDGYFDVIVGAEAYTNGQSSEGRATLYLGSPAGPSAIPAWTAEADLAGALYGHAVASAGDVNRDGYSDVIVGAYRYDNNTTGGRVYLYLGSPSGLTTSPVWTEGAQSASAWYGYSIAGAGDVNGDGYSDIIVGAPGWNEFGGAAYLYQGNASGIPVLTWFKTGTPFADVLGAPVGTAGDVNGDGYADVFACKNGASSYVYLGSSSGLSTAPAWQSGLSCDSFASAGDVNGDGYADMVLGSYSGGALFGGIASVFYGNGGPGVSLNPRQVQQDFFGFKPIAPGGRSNVPGSFDLLVNGRTPFGRSKVRMEWEIEPLGTLLGGPPMIDSSSTDTGTAGAILRGGTLGRNPGPYHWRLRLYYDAAKSPFAQHSRWMTIPWHGWQEAHLTLGATLGGWVWNDLDRDGVRDNGEPGYGGASVLLLNSSGATVAQTTTIGDGYYRFVLPNAESSFQLRFVAPSGTSLTLQDQGADDESDSDPDPLTGLTPLIGPVFTYVDDRRWGAGLLCNAPTLPVAIAARPVPGTANLILDITDPNPFSQVTGYNVYRASQPQPPPSPWTLLGANVTDNDLSTSNIQWTDTTGATPTLGGVFYYQVTAFNSSCNAEGPR